MLMEAAKRVIDKNPVDEFSVQKVAEEAGVSHRTIYRYFPSRQELLDAFTDWMEDTVAPVPPIMPTVAEDVATTVRQAFARFDRHAPYFRAGLILANRGEPIQPHRQKDRDRMVREALKELLEPLDEEQAEAVYAVLRHLVGAHTWHVLHDRFELRDGHAGEAVAWAAEVLLDAVRAGRLPESPKRIEAIDTSES
jgi:AcrR family transcriptional regulator